MVMIMKVMIRERHIIRRVRGEIRSRHFGRCGWDRLVMQGG